MNYEQAFLQAIRETPDDDAPRLIYADWLEEHNQPERAEFIRVQCALARGGDNPVTRERLEGRERELLRAYGKEWMVRELGQDHGFEKMDFTRTWSAQSRGYLYFPKFHRGFVAGISCTPKMFLEHADQWFRQAPIQFLKIIPLVHNGTRCHPTEQELNDLEAVLTSEHMKHITYLELEQWRLVGDRQIAENIMQKDHFPNLQGLRLQTVMRSDTIDRLLSCRENGQLPKLKKLILPRYIHYVGRGNPCDHYNPDYFNGCGLLKDLDYIDCSGCISNRIINNGVRTPEQEYALRRGLRHSNQLSHIRWKANQHGGRDNQGFPEVSFMLRSYPANNLQR